MNTTSKILGSFLALTLLTCSGKKSQQQFQSELKSLDLVRGDIALCGSGKDQFGTVSFSQACSPAVKEDFNLATALLHSFEYTEAEKVFAKIAEADPSCVMAYWGLAMCSFHPLWAAPSEAELQKGARIIAMARSYNKDKSSRESDYLEAIAAIYDQWDQLDHRTRVLKFEDACARVYAKYPNDSEAAIFYALALRAASDPSDKSFTKQKKAGEILNGALAREPNHPGIAHYIIHTFDYPELAELGLPAARKYASIAAASAHAQHMPSHIFTRLGLWDESIQSNIKSISAAQCYAQNMGIQGHWDEELHGMDYLVYAYLQEAKDAQASEQMEYLKTFRRVFPENFKGAYTFAAMPTRYALERKDWTAAARLDLNPSEFPWEKFPWEKANVHFGRLLGAVHTHQLKEAGNELEQLTRLHQKLTDERQSYKANLVLIQMKAGEGWIRWAEGKKQEAITLMTDAADREDKTEKDAVTPGEVIPARELLGDMYMELGMAEKALEAYELDLARHPNRFNGVYGAGHAAEKAGDAGKAIGYYEKLVSLANPANSDRPQLAAAVAFIRKG